ncbi:MAG: S24 family peptidase [Bacteroidota bacterium]
MSRRTLTSKQNAFMSYLIDHIRDQGVWPTYREMVDHFGYRSPNSVTQNLQALMKKGYLRRESGSYQFTDQRPFRTARVGIPIRGIITAGPLQDAVEAELGEITLDMLFPNLDRIFAIRVKGDSMIGADINDGDFVLLIDDDIPNGGIGAVLYGGQTTLKRIYHDKSGIRLEPANDEYPDVHINPDVFEEVRVLGRYIGHVNHRGIYKKAS